MNETAARPVSGDPSTELSSRRTGMSFQRTRLSAERTLMSVIRTSLSLIGFGFTIGQFFHRLQDTGMLADKSAAPRDFGLALIALGIVTLVLGIVGHVAFMQELRAERRQLTAEGLVHGDSRFPISTTLIVAVCLFAVGLLAIASLTLQIGPFG
jgi:putative membrane protein